MWVQTADSLRVEELATIYMVAPELSPMRLEVEFQHQKPILAPRPRSYKQKREDCVGIQAIPPLVRLSTSIDIVELKQPL